jgi:predicted DNA-binding transcriptional regulator AlpA
MDAPAHHRALPPPTARLLSRPEAAAYAGVSPTTFDRLMNDGFMPAPKRIYSRVLWDVRALDAAIDCLPSPGDSQDADNSDLNEWD